MFNKEPFVVSSETVCVNGEWYDLNDTTHCVVDGQEYIWLEDQWYELTDSVVGDPAEAADEEPDYPQYEPPPRSRGWGSTIITVLIVLCIVGAGLKVMKVLDRADDAIGRAEASVPSSVVAVGTATPKSAPTANTPDARAARVVEAMDYTNPTTRDYALSLIDREHGGKYNIEQICDVWEKIYNKWTYVNDPKGSNYYSPASRTIKLGVKGDCDDFAILVASTMMAIGGSPRIILASNVDRAGHAYAEVCIADSKTDLDKAAKYICQRYKCQSIAYRTSNDGGKTRYWLNLDWQAKHPGGPYYKNDGETLAIYENKYWVRLK